MDDEQPRDADGPPPSLDDTQPLDAVIKDDPQRWTASAPVPVAEPPTAPTAGPVDEVRPDGYLDPTADRNWLTPLLYGFLGLLLLGVLLAGIWLISKADDGEPAPVPSATAPTAAPTPAPPPVTTTKTTKPPPSNQPPSTVTTSVPEPTTQPEPTTAAGGEVTVPPVVGLAEDEARQRLSDAGLRFEVTRQPDADHVPGTVLSMSPGPGTSVASNSVVRLVVASAPQNAP